MSHLGDRAAALVDGQLTPDAADRATAHLATCRPCRDLVELERLMKRRLAALRGPAPSSDLVGRLLAMGGPAGPLPPRPGHVPGMPRPQTVPLHSTAGAAGGVGLAPRTTAPRTTIRPAGRPTSNRPGGRPAVLTQRRARFAAAVLGALSVVGVGVAGVTIASASGAAVPRPVPARMGTVSTPIGASALTTTLSGSSFDWQETPSSGAAGGTQRILARR